MKKPLSWFKTDPNQPRKTYDEAKLKRLGESMKECQLQPVGAKPDGTLLWGERRWRAAKLAGIDELTVTIIEKALSDTEGRVIQLTENMHRSDLTGYEKWMACAELLCANPDWMLKDLAEHLCLDQSTLTRIMSPSKCTAAWQEALKAGKVGISDCYAASKLPESEQAELLALKLSGMSRDDLERHSRKQRAKPSVKTGKVRIAMPDNIAVVLSGGDFGMAEVVDVLGDALKEARKASEQYDVKTFQSMMRDRAKLQR